MASSSVCRQTTAFEIHTKGHNVPTTQEGGGGGGVTLLYGLYGEVPLDREEELSSSPVLTASWISR